MSGAVLDVSDLVGREYNAHAGPDEFRCWHLVREVLARLGVQLPLDQAEALALEGTRWTRLPATVRKRVGDVLMMKGVEEGESHVAVMIDGWRFLHATRMGNVVAGRADRFVAAGEVLYVARLEELQG